MDAQALVLKSTTALIIQTEAGDRTDATMEWCFPLTVTLAAYGALRLVADLVRTFRRAGVWAWWWAATSTPASSTREREAAMGMQPSPSPTIQRTQEHGRVGESSSMAAQAPTKPGAKECGSAGVAKPLDQLEPRLALKYQGFKITRLGAIQLVEVLDGCEFTVGKHLGSTFIHVWHNDPEFMKWIKAHRSSCTTAVYDLFNSYISLQHLLQVA